MAVPIGKGRFYKLFTGSSQPKRLLIEDITAPGFLSDVYVQGIVAKVCAIKSSPRYGKLCKFVLKEDVEETARCGQAAAIINVFLLGDMADEGCHVLEGHRVVLSEVIAECSPTDEHNFQLILWREKSRASMWVISGKGKVRANTVDGVKMLPVSCESDEKLKTLDTCYSNYFSDEEEKVMYESRESNLSQQVDCEKKENPHTITNNLCAADTNVSAGNPVRNCMGSVAVDTGMQSMAILQKPTPDGKGQAVSLCIQSANPTSEQPDIQCTQIEFSPARVSTRVWKDQDPCQPGACQLGVVTKALPQLLAPDCQVLSQSSVDESNGGGETVQRPGDPQEQPIGDTHARTSAVEEGMVNVKRVSSSWSFRSQGGSAKEFPHHFTVGDEDLTPRSRRNSLIPNDYTPAASLLTGNKGGVKRTSPEQVLDPKRVCRSVSPGTGPYRRSPSPSSRVRQTSRAATDYTVPSGYTTLVNLQPDTTVNVYGVVKLFKPAWKCRGTDMCSVLMLMDPTVAESGGLECVSFQPNVSRLPNVQKVGDIVRLHRIKISNFQGRLQAKSTRGFAAVVFDRDTELPVTADMARVSSSTFTLTQNDKETIESLKNWCDAHPVLFPPNNVLTVSQITPDAYFDIVCQVLGVALHRTLDCVVLYVTDGSHPKHDLRKCEGDDYNVVEPLHDCSSDDIDVISVFLYGSHAEVARLLAKKGKYVILHNVHSQVLKPGGSCSVLDVVKPYLELCVHRGTAFGRGLTVLSPDAPEVKQVKRNQGF